MGAGVVGGEAGWQRGRKSIQQGRDACRWVRVHYFGVRPLYFGALLQVLYFAVLVRALSFFVRGAIAAGW